MLLSIDKNTDQKRIPTRVTIDLDMEGKTGTKVGGYLSSRLRNYKKSLDPLTK